MRPPHPHEHRPRRKLVDPEYFRVLKDRNSALLRSDILQRRSRFRGLPEVVSLYTSDICNLRCTMCPRSLAQGTHKLDRTALERVCHELFPTARKAILTAAAGEPLLADFDVVLQHALHYGVKLDLITNGTHLTKDLFERAAPALDHVNVSLDSCREEVYAQIRAGGRLEDVVANLRDVQAVRAAHHPDVLLSVSFLVQRANLRELPEFVRYAADLGVDGVLGQRLQHTVLSSPDADPGDLDAPAHRAIFDAARAAARERGIHLLLQDLGLESVQVGAIRPKIPAPIEGQSTCWFVAQNFGVLYNGDVYPCCVPTDHRLGNVHDADAASIWNGAAARRLRKAHFDGVGTAFCSGCMHAPHLATAPRASQDEREALVAANHAVTEREDVRRTARPTTARTTAGTRPDGDLPRVFYVCNWNTHAGGIQVLYDHVAGLRAMGVDARLGAYETFQRCDWFDHDPAETPAQDRLLDELLPDDVVVLPEICMWDEQLVGHPARQIVFVQNPELMTGDLSEWRFERVLAPSAVLEPWIRGLQGFDGAIDIVPGHLPDSMILPLRTEPREDPADRPRVLLIDRVGKHDGQVGAVFEQLCAAGYRATMHDQTVHRSAFAALFAAHDIYVHLSRSEGFPVSILEAFGAGALVVGFAGRGGLEFMQHGDNCLLADDGDIPGVLRAVADASTLPPHRRQNMLRAARETARHWTLARQRTALGQFAETLRRRRRGRALRAASATMALRR